MKKHLFTTGLAICIAAAPLFAQPKREFRAAWIATVANIDWPTRPELSTEQQQQEMINLLDAYKALNMNAIVFQIRPTADAFYQSDLEPWSHFLTGKQGLAPEPFYDPLAFVVEEAHKRCIDVHVWLNPYRTLNSDKIEILNPDHLFFKKPHLFVKYGNQYYFNPALDETRQFVNKVVADIVTRYDIDAIHFDDYFYPYKVKNEEFPDSAAFAENPRGFSPDQKDDWRRNNVNLVIAELQNTIKSIKPWVEFGISPFGVWRNAKDDPRGSATTAGTTNYDQLYADILKWLEEGSIDYVVPQLYWEIGKKVADYAVLIDWWNNYNYGKNLYIGLYASNLGNKKAAPAWCEGNELVRQLELNKNYKNVQGAVYFSGKALLENKLGLNDSLKEAFYKYPALVPVNSNIKGEAAAQPQKLKLTKTKTAAELRWNKIEAEGGKTIMYYVVYAFEGKGIGSIEDAKNIVAITANNCLDITDFMKDKKGKYTFTVTAVNKYKHESVASKPLTKRF